MAPSQQLQATPFVMATPCYPRNHVFPVKNGKDPKTTTTGYLRCDNPMCGWVYKISALSFESDLLESVLDLVNPKYDSAPTVRYFCPAADSVDRRLEKIRKNLTDLAKQHPEVARRMDQLHKLVGHVCRVWTDMSCREKFIEHQRKLAQAEALRQQREKFARCNDVSSERDYPEDMRIDQNPELADLLRLESVFGALTEVDNEEQLIEYTYDE